MRSKIRNAFRKGLENVTSQEKGLNLEHIGFRNIDDQETHAELIIKALANEYNYQNFIVANSHSPDQFAPPDDPNEAHHSSLFFKIENYLSARFRSNILELIADHGLFPDASLAVLSADNLVKGCGSKFQSALMTPEEILTTFFNDDNISFLNFIGRNEKIFLDFAENFTPSVLKLYFANLPRSLEFVALLMRSANFIDLDMDKVLDLYKRSVIANPRHISTSRNLLVRWTSYLDELLQLGKVSLSQVIELHRDLRSKGVNLDFGYLKNALKSEKTDFMQVADFCREQLDNPETVKDSFGILLHLSELGKFGVEDIIQLCGELSNNEDTEKAVFSNLGKFAPLISSGKISSDVVANFYKSALKKEKKINYEPIVALRDLANLIPSGHIDHNVVLDLFYDVLAT